MNNDARNGILKDFQIKKFCAYGFLKNLKFFEPYLLIYLMSNDINLFQIGMLIAVREVIINAFEIPSGLIADHFGRKKEMYFCFGFYIVSFILFFFADTFILAAFAMVFFGFGEAFRSGTHKAMIYTYLDAKKWQGEKTFVFGRTRSFSLIGSAISSIVGIVLILIVPSDGYIFLFSVVPYILDLLLIMSYPKFLDTSDKKHGTSFKEMAKGMVDSFRINKKLRNILIEEGVAEAGFSYVKDLIQPILEIIIIGSGISVIAVLSADDNLKVMLGLIYTVLNLLGSYFSRKAYILKGKRTSLVCLSLFHLAYAALFGLLAIFSGQYLVVCVIYVLVYVLHSARKPMFVDEIDNNIDKSNRATVISASAQLKSLFLIVCAPIFGFIADNVGIWLVMVILCLAFALTLPLLRSKIDKPPIHKNATF